MVRKKLIYHRYLPPEHGKGFLKSSWSLFQLQISLKSSNPRNTCLWEDVSVTRIGLAAEVSDQNLDARICQWPEFGCKEMSVTRIWLWVDVSMTKTDVCSQPNSGHWRLLTTQFWSHWRLLIDTYYEDFSFKSWFEAEKGFSFNFFIIFHVQGA